jgi:hypothetical protein
MDVEEIKCVVMGLILAAQDEDQWWTHANKHSVSIKEGKCLYQMKNY